MAKTLILLLRQRGRARRAAVSVTLRMTCRSVFIPQPNCNVRWTNDAAMRTCKAGKIREDLFGQSFYNLPGARNMPESTRCSSRPAGVGQAIPADAP